MERHEEGIIMNRKELSKIINSMPESHLFVVKCDVYESTIIDCSDILLNEKVMDIVYKKLEKEVEE